MIICSNILLQNDGEIVSYQRGNIIFKENTDPKYYFQIKSGTVKLNTITCDGKEYLYGLPFQGHCIAESYVFSQKKYPFNAIAVTNCEVIRLIKSKFLDLMKHNPQLLMDVFAYSSDRTHYKNLMLSTLGVTNSMERLIKLLDYIKDLYRPGSKEPFIIPFTRQQLACLSGLCLETIIRTVKKMESNKLLYILHGKIHY